MYCFLYSTQDLKTKKNLVSVRKLFFTKPQLPSCSTKGINQENYIYYHPMFKVP